MASEPGRAQTSDARERRTGVVGPANTPTHNHSNTLEGVTREGESPVKDDCGAVGWDPEYHETREILWEAGGTTLQGSTPRATDSEQVP